MTFHFVFVCERWAKKAMRRRWHCCLADYDCHTWRMKKHSQFLCHWGNCLHNLALAVFRMCGYNYSRERFHCAENSTVELVSNSFSLISTAWISPKKRLMLLLSANWSKRTQPDEISFEIRNIAHRCAHSLCKQCVCEQHESSSSVDLRCGSIHKALTTQMHRSDFKLIKKNVSRTFFSIERCEIRAQFHLHLCDFINHLAQHIHQLRESIFDQTRVCSPKS